MMLISELLHHLKSIQEDLGDVPVKIDGDFFGDCDPVHVQDVHVGKFVADETYAVILYPHKIVAESLGHA